MNRQALAVMAACALSVGGVLPAAHADSVSGQASNAVADCGGISTNASAQDTVVGLVTTVVNVGTGSGVGNNACQNDAANLANEQAGFAAANALAAADEAQSV